MWSKCTQWVFIKELTENSQCSSISPQTLKELTKYTLGTFWSHGEYFLNEPSANSKQVAQAHSEHILRSFLKETEGFFHKVSAGYFFVWIVKGIKGFTCNSTNIYPLGSWWVLLNVPSPAIGRYLGGYFVKIPKMYPVSIWVSEFWANCKINQNELGG